MANLMTREDVIALLRQFIEKAGTQAKAAEAIGVSPAYLSDVMNGNRDPGGSILRHFDIELVKAYRKTK